MAKSESRRLALVIAAGLAIGLLGAGIYFFRVQPRQERDAARTQLAAWETQWVKVEGCLFGGARRAADPADAIDVARFTADLDGCGADVGKLNRPEGQAVQDEAIENAWRELEAKAAAVAKRYASFVTARAPDARALGAAIAELDQAHDRLRTALDLAPVPRTAPAVAPVTATAIEPQVADAKLAWIRSGGAVVQLGIAARDARYEVILRNATEVTVRRIGPDSVRSAPAGTWGAVIDENDAGEVEIRAGAVDDNGEVGSASVRVASGDAAAPVLLGAIGEGANRLIAASSPVQTRLYRSRDSGATWTQLEGVPAGRPRLAGDPANGALDLTWSFGPELRWTRLDDAHIAAPSPIVSLGESGELCTASSAAWTIDRGRGYERVPLAGEATFSMLPGAMRALACTDDQVLIATDEDVQRCDAEGCKVVVRGVPTKRFGYGAMVGDDVAYAGQQGAVAGVWRGDDVRFVRIPDTMRVQAVALWGGKPHLVLMGDKGAAVAAVP